ncbi:MAG: metallophosphoesterase [Verrucomicrobiota bacterium]
MKIKTTHPATQLLWLSDLHLDLSDEETRARFLKKINLMDYDAAVLTGDISSSPNLCGHLRALAESCSPRPLHVVLGNHDFHGSSIGQVEGLVADICQKQDNLCHLGFGEIIPLGYESALVGHRGWADGRAGWGHRTVVESRDHRSIDDLRKLSRKEMFNRMEVYGRESAAYFRKVLPYALTRFQHVIIATHVPPFGEVAQYNCQPCGPTHLPHFVNVSAGCAIIGIARQFPRRQITVICGHTHSAKEAKILDNLTVQVGGAQKGRPAIQRILQLN